MPVADLIPTYKNLLTLSDKLDLKALERRSRNRRYHRYADGMAHYRAIDEIFQLTENLSRLRATSPQGAALLLAETIADTDELDHENDDNNHRIIRNLHSILRYLLANGGDLPERLGRHLGRRWQAR